MHSHASLTQTARAMHHMRLDQDQVAVVMSSMTHLIGFAMVFLSGLLNGATVVITRPFDFRSVLEAYGAVGLHLHGWPPRDVSRSASSAS